MHFPTDPKRNFRDTGTVRTSWPAFHKFTGATTGSFSGEHYRVTKEGRPEIDDGRAPTLTKHSATASYFLPAPQK